MTIITELQALKVAADEVLIIRILEEPDDALAEALLDALELAGLKERSLLFFGNAEFTVAKK